MKSQNESPLKVIRLQRNSASNQSQENTQQVTVGQNINAKHQVIAMNYIEKIRCNSENLRQQQRKLGTSYAEQLTLASLNAMITQSTLSNNKSSAINSLEASQIRQGPSYTSNQSLNDSLVKKNNKRVIISALKIRTQIVKNIEEEVEGMDCDSIVHDELVRYRRLRTDSIIDNCDLNKEDILKELQAMRRSNSGMNTPLRRQSNALNTSKGQRDIKSLQASKDFNEYLKKQLEDNQRTELQENRKNGCQNFMTEVESPELKQLTSFQKALTELEDEISQLNMNCKKRYERSRRTLISRRGLPSSQGNRSNTQYLSSEEDQDFQNTVCKGKIIQNSNHQQQQTLFNVFALKNSSSQEIKNFDYLNGNALINNAKYQEDEQSNSNLWRTKIYNPDDRQKNLIRVNTEAPQKKKFEDSTGNFGIFKNQFIQQMQSKSAAKQSFTNNDSSYYMGDVDTASSKQSSELSTKKNSCESEEIIPQTSQINLQLPTNVSQSADQGDCLAELQITPNRYYSVQKHQDYLERSCGNLVNILSNNKNVYVPAFQFGANGFLNQSLLVKEGSSTPNNNNQQIRGNNIRSQKKSRSMTPMKGTTVNQQKSNSQNKPNQTSSTNDICVTHQTELLLNGISSQPINLAKDIIEQPNKSPDSKYKFSNVLINNKNPNNNALEKSTIETFNDTEYRKNSYCNQKRVKRRNLTTNPQRGGNSKNKEESSPVNEFKQKLLNKVVNNIFTKKQPNQAEIGDSNNNTFQIRRIQSQKPKNEISETAKTTCNNFYLNNKSCIIAPSQAITKVNVLNFENKDLKMNNDVAISSNNIQSNQEKLNNLLKKKYKYTNNKRFLNNNIQNQLMQDCHSKIFTAEDDVTYFTKNLIDSPTRIQKLAVEAIPITRNDNFCLKV